MNKLELKEILNNFITYYHIRDMFGSNDEAIEKHLMQILLDVSPQAYITFYDTLDSHGVRTLGNTLDALENTIEKL